MTKQTHYYTSIDSRVQIEDWKHLSFPRADERDQQTPQPAGEDSTSQHQLTPGDEITEVADGDMDIDEG